MNISFVHDATKAQRALVAVFDLAGFSTFCDHPEGSTRIPPFIASVFSLLGHHFADAPFFQLFQRAEHQFSEPDFIKFTGDGALLLWVRDMDENFDPDDCTAIVTGMRAFQLAYQKKVPEMEAEQRVSGLPKSLRVGMTLGTVYPLFRPPFGTMVIYDQVDYVGYCINLAFRLQAYYPEIGFIVSKTINPKIEGLQSVTAHNIKGSHEEEVLVFDDDRRREFYVNEVRYRSKLK